MRVHKPIESGDLLVAAPPGQSNDPFYRTVVLICKHDDSDGTVGLVMNRPTNVTLDHLVEQPVGKYVVHYGGPLEHEYLTYLHQHGDEIHEARPITQGVFFCRDFGDAVRIVNDQEITPKHFRFFIGYSGWAVGQLEDELKQGYWCLTQATPDLIFCRNPNKLWSLVLRRMGGEYALLANFPHDLSMN